MAEPHEHQFKVKFSQHHAEEYTIYCDQPCRVLEAIKTLDIYEEKINCADEKIIIQMGKGDNECSIATHFPCSCIEDNEVLTISCTSEIVEEVQPDFKRSENICTKDRYSIFYIDKVGGKDTKSKDLFRNNAVKQFKYLCVYGEKGITVEDALNRDGRFIDDLGYFKLSENENTITECTQKVNKMDNKKFKICLQRQKNKNAYSSIIKVAQQKGKHVKKKETNGDADTNEIDELLREQFPDLKRWMESDGDLYKQALNLRKENFQQSFSEVHRVHKLLELGKSVCKVAVKDVSVGTGFVLFDTFILTSAHYFKGSVHENKLKENVDVFAIFDYEDPETETNFYYFRAKDTFIDFDADLDYAVLELNPEGSNPTLQKRAQNIKVPPGLISKFGSLPDNEWVAKKLSFDTMESK
ncbi:protein FAM111A-like [Neolamprologus brichardi]|uniref:protein FAM111A-like n=1 Tax=Neolamprologus brichardi TaxID=32507 RepID=UPI0003EBDE8F|nr:protein FAM111A-like [Neolamprologus brichardi]